MVGSKELESHLVAVKTVVILPPDGGAVGLAAGHVLNLAGGDAKLPQGGLLLRFVGIVHDHLVIVPGFAGSDDELHARCLHCGLPESQLRLEVVQQGDGRPERKLERHGLVFQRHLTGFNGHCSAVTVGPRQGEPALAGKR